MFSGCRYAIHHDPSIWPDPDNFNPEANFTKANSETGALELTRTEFLLPFGIGRRVCLGEALARQELLIFFAGLMQHFHIVPVSVNGKTQTLPPIDKYGDLGTIATPPDYEVCFESV